MSVYVITTLMKEQRKTKTESKRAREATNGLKNKNVAQQPYTNTKEIHTS